MAQRCDWPGDDPLMIRYHDEEWGVPLHDDRKHFEFIILDGAQAGLSWRTVLHRREGYRAAFADFDAAAVARFNARRIAALLKDERIIRNRAKVQSAVRNAQAFLKVQEACGTFDAYVWQFTDGRTIQHRCRRDSDIPATSKESDAMSRDMKARGFSFVGSTICYAYMQAAGMVNDHLVRCVRHAQLREELPIAARLRTRQ